MLQICVLVLKKQYCFSQNRVAIALERRYNNINKNVAQNYMAPGKDQVAAGTRPRYCFPQAYNISTGEKNG